MIKKLLPWAIAGSLGLAAGATLLPNNLRPIPGVASMTSEAGGATANETANPTGGSHGDENASESHDDEEKAITLSAEQIRRAGIEVAPVTEGRLSNPVSVPGTITANADTLSHVPASVPGIVRDLRKQLGDTVVRGEVLGLIESREIAEAKGEYLAAQRSNQLVRTVLRREESLWAKRISAEQDVLEARSAAEEARIRLDLARQKLTAMGVTSGQIQALSSSGGNQLRFHEVRAPVAGRVIERQAALGASVQGDSDLFVIADLSTLWIELAVSPLDLVSFQEGKTVAVNSGTRKAEATLIFVGPVVDNETRTARAVALLRNEDRAWRPGDYVTAAVEGNESGEAALVIPRGAVQTINGEQVAFVRTADGFEMREIVLGRGNDTSAEVVFGLDAGEQIAISNSFVLKAELGKSEAEHSH